MSQSKNMYPIHEGRARLSKLIERAVAGETIVICRGNTPMVRLAPVQEHTHRGRVFGGHEGQGTVTGAFFEPLPADVLAAWE